MPPVFLRLPTSLRVLRAHPLALWLAALMLTAASFCPPIQALRRTMGQEALRNVLPPLPAVSRASPVKIADLTGLGWFGIAEEDIRQTSGSVSPQPGSWRVKGVSLSGKAALNGAFFVDPAGKERYCRLHEKLPDGLTLDAVFSDHIVLQTNGKKMTLPFMPADK